MNWKEIHGWFWLIAYFAFCGYLLAIFFGVVPWKS